MSPNAGSKSTEYVRHTVAVPWCLARDDTLEQQPTLFLFQSLIAALCSNSSCLDKDSLTLRVGYESGSPTQMPVCVHCTSFAARLNKWINSHSGNIAWMDRAGQALGVPLMYPPPKRQKQNPNLNLPLTVNCYCHPLCYKAAEGVIKTSSLTADCHQQFTASPKQPYSHFLNGFNLPDYPIGLPNDSCVEW